MVHHFPNLDRLKSAWQEKYRAKQQLQAVTDPQLQLQQGNKLLVQNKLDEAIAYYRRALKLDPDSRQAHQQLAVALKQQGKLTEANLHYRQAIDARLASASSNLPTPLPQPQLARIYLHQAQSFKAEEAWQKSIVACQQALACAPKLAEAYQTWGDNLLSMGKTTEAIGYYGKALAIKPIAEVCLNLGSLSCKQQQWQLAIDYFQQAIAIDSRCGSAYRNLARVYKKLGQQRLMLDCWFTALQIEPERASVVELCNLARMMEEIGYRDRAVACYQLVLNLSPQSASVYLQLAELLIENSPQAIAVLQQGLKYFPRHGELNLRLGQLLEPDVSQAIAHYRRAIEARPQYWRAYFYLGNALAKQQKYDAAVDCYQQVCQLQPDYLPTYLQLAQVLSAIAQWSAVVRVCQRGLSLDSQQEPLYNLLGVALIQLQRYETAIKVYACYLKLNPQNIDSYRNLGLALMAEQRWTEAVSCYRQVLEREPNCSDWRQLGEAAAQAEDWKTSAIAWKEAVKLQPEEPWSYHHLGVTLIELEKWCEAAIALQQSIDLNPDFSWSYFHLGDALAKQQHWQESSAAYRYFLTQETNGYAYERLGDNLMRESESSEAEACYYRALEVEPDYLQPYYKLMELRPYDGKICIMLAQTYARQSEWATAIIFYQIGLGIDPNCSQGHFELGILLERQQHDEAIAHLRLAAKLDPHEPQYQSYLQAIAQPNDVE